MTSVQSELERSFESQNVKQTNRKLSIGGKILIALSGLLNIKVDLFGRNAYMNFKILEIPSN